MARASVAALLFLGIVIGAVLYSALLTWLAVTVSLWAMPVGLGLAAVAVTFGVGIAVYRR